MQSDTTTSIILGENKVKSLHSEEWVILWVSIIAAPPKWQLLIISSHLRGLEHFYLCGSLWISWHSEALTAVRLMGVDSNEAIPAKYALALLQRAKDESAHRMERF